MKNVGLFFIVVGAAGLVYNLMGYSHRLLAVFGEYQRHAAGASIAIGVVLFLIGMKGGKKKDEKK